ncbi:MAG: phosphoenolpyruvate synthase [Haloquadratum sp.]|jgi:pyruvate,water dikinase|nr:phosphoenolpyruvate synthase [Haloferacaceae archaeon]MDR9444910.1 phosphoenolpyruvate synthase [Haloquadratum sp.]
MGVEWLEDVRAADIDRAGGKAASLGELTAAGLPVPPGFVVTADTYRRFIENAEIDGPLFEAVAVDHEDSTGLREAHERAHRLIMDTPLPEAVEAEILDAFYEMAGEGQIFVAVRSSATAEDLPDASFAGQQETFLNVDEDAVLDRVKACWASLFSQRAIYYRNRQGFAHEEVDIAVVVQEMVDAAKSGVLFTSHPSTGAAQMIIEAAWGLGEAVVSGTVSPDNYVVDKTTLRPDSVTVADKKVLMERDGDSGETIERPVTDARRAERVLSDAEIEELCAMGAEVEAHYGSPQDVEWAMADGTLYMLQSRPITTIAEAPDPAVDQDDGSTEAIVEGLGASPGTASGTARVITKLDHLDQVREGDVIITEMTMPDMVPAMKRAAGIITDEGGMTSHASIVSRELGVPAVVGTQQATTIIEDGQPITLDGDRGVVTAGTMAEPEPAPVEAARPTTPVKPMTATKVLVNVSIPEAAERAAATGADGVGLLRMEHMVLSLGMTPAAFVERHGKRAYIDELIAGIRQVADEFYPRPVRVRTLDAPTDEFRELEGGGAEPVEHNPMMGFRGIRRSLAYPEEFHYELTAFKRLFGLGYDNIEIMLPMVNDATDVRRAREELEAVGIDPRECRWGVMIETPASALAVDAMAAEGIDFVSFGTNDLTQYMLAVDRNNEQVADRFDELHPAVLRLIGQTIELCREEGVATSICGQAGSKSTMVRFLVEAGISSISANIDAVRDVQHEVKRVEQRLILDAIR